MFELSFKLFRFIVLPFLGVHEIIYILHNSELLSSISFFNLLANLYSFVISDQDIFHGLLVVLYIKHALIIFIVGIDSVQGGANGPQNKVKPIFLAQKHTMLLTIQSRTMISSSSNIIGKVNMCAFQWYDTWLRTIFCILNHEFHELQNLNLNGPLSLNFFCQTCQCFGKASDIPTSKMDWHLILVSNETWQFILCKKTK